MITFFPQGKVIVPFWKLSVNAWNVPLIFFPSARLFACIQVMCQPVTSSTDGLISSEQRSKQLSREGWACVCVCVCVWGGLDRPHSVVLLWHVKCKLPEETEIFWEICDFCMKTPHYYQTKSQTVIPLRETVFWHIRQSLQDLQVVCGTVKYLISRQRFMLSACFQAFF